MFVDGLLISSLPVVQCKSLFFKSLYVLWKYCFYAYNEYTEKRVSIWERKKEKEMGRSSIEF